MNVTIDIVHQLDLFPTHCVCIFRIAGYLSIW